MARSAMIMTELTMLQPASCSTAAAVGNCRKTSIFLEFPGVHLIDKYSLAVPVSPKSTKILKPVIVENCRKSKRFFYCLAGHNLVS